ncbi:MAG: response regulator [Chlorobi bacterium]|nr:response regulator [Chlorobiota bacterium]
MEPFFYADSEPPGSPDISPPGQVYTEASASLRNVFTSGKASVEGPLPDRWGVWVSGFLPLTDPASGKVVAVLGMDVDAADWTWDTAARSSLPIGAVIIGTIIIAALLLSSSRYAVTVSGPIFGGLLPLLSVLLFVCVSGIALMLWFFQDRRLQEVVHQTEKEVLKEFRNSVLVQSEGHDMTAQALVADPAVADLLRKRDGASLQKRYRELFGRLHKEYGISCFCLSDSAGTGFFMPENDRKAGVVFREPSVSAAQVVRGMRSGVALDEDGLMLGRSIKGEGALSATSLLMMDSISTRPEAVASMPEVFAAILVKPVRQSELFNALVDVLFSDGGGRDGNKPQKKLHPADTGKLTGAGGRQAVRNGTVRILLAEDSSVNQMVVVGMLGRLGYAVDVVSNGKEALDHLRKGSYNLVYHGCPDA